MNEGRSLAVLSEFKKTDAFPCLLSRDPVVAQWRCWRSASPSWQQGAISKRDARSAELIVPNYVIRTPHPTQERCDQTTALLDA